MENKLYKVLVRLGAHVEANFDAKPIPSTDGSIVLSHYDGELRLSDRGMLRICEADGTIGLMYDIFTTVGYIKTKKEVDGNYYLICSNDLFDEIEIFVVDREEWATSGDSIFHC